MYLLKGKNIVITRARNQTSSFAALLKSYGARVLCCPTIRVLPPPAFEPMDRSIGDLDSYDWLIFTSVNGVEWFMKRFIKSSGKRGFPSRLKTCAIGPVTAGRMSSFGLPVTKVSKEYVAESILKELPRVLGKKILIPRALQAREVLPRELRRRGAVVHLVAAYQTVLDRSNYSAFQDWLKDQLIHCVTFTSSSTVRNFFSLLRSSEKKQLLRSQDIQAASIGPVTTQTLKEFGWMPKIVAAKPTTQHLAASIVEFYKRRAEDSSLDPQTRK